jgi:hypothetical protein
MQKCFVILDGHVVLACVLEGCNGGYARAVHQIPIRV